MSPAIDIEATDEQALTPLHLACTYGQQECARWTKYFLMSKNILLVLLLNWVFATNSDFLVPISLQPNAVDLRMPGLDSSSYDLSIYKFGLSVCLYPINVKTAKPIGPKFFVGHLGTPGKVYEWSKFQIFVSFKNQTFIKFLKVLKIHEIFFVKIRELFLFCFTMYTKRTCSNNLEDGREAPFKDSVS